jgi:4-oxalocrotonate tautomerase
MPIVHVEMWEGRTKEEKAEIAKAFADDLMRIFKCREEAITIIFTDVSKENWAKGGTLACDLGK